jgi:hypothetical protein
LSAADDVYQAGTGAGALAHAARTIPETTRKCFI